MVIWRLIAWMVFTVVQRRVALAGDAERERASASLREHYAMTLRHWVRTLEEKRLEATELVGEHHYRIWRLYMGASANSFATAAINILQTVLAKPDERGRSNVPLTREDLYANR